MIGKIMKPLISFILSILVPGLGQVYNSQLKKGIIIYSSFLFLEFIIIPVFRLQFTFSGIMLCLVLFISIYIYAIADSIYFSIVSNKQKIFSYNKWFIYLLAIIFNISIHTIFELSDYWGVEPYSIPTSAMEPTLLHGDYIIADLTAYDSKTPEPGDIIIFQYPLNPELDYIKRCIAVGGQTLEIIDKKVFVNGVRFADSSFVKFIDRRILTKEEGNKFFKTYNNLGSRDNFGPILIPEGHYFVMGDSRDNSADSRVWGFVPEQNLKGKALFIYFSWDKSAQSFSKKIRSKRMGLNFKK
jgi:signal peptidase I